MHYTGCETYWCLIFEVWTTSSNKTKVNDSIMKLCCIFMYARAGELADEIALISNVLSGVVAEELLGEVWIISKLSNSGYKTKYTWNFLLWFLWFCFIQDTGFLSISNVVSKNNESFSSFLSLLVLEFELITKFN